MINNLENKKVMVEDVDAHFQERVHFDEEKQIVNLIYSGSK